MTEVFAHRGAHLVERENTLGAFREAIRLGVDGVELDVRRTRDGVFVVHHNSSVGQLVIAETNASQLPSFVPTLDEAMEALRGVTVNVELKNFPDPLEPHYDDTGAFVHGVLDCLHEGDWTTSVILSCFDLKSCVHARAYDVDVRVAWLIWNVLLPPALTEAHVLGFDAVNPRHSLVTAEGCELAQKLGLAINVWTVNESSDIVAMGELGVASVITDQPVLAKELLGAVG